MQLLFGKKTSVLKVDPCGVCGEWVGCNGIQCMKQQWWVHRRCSDVPRQESLLSCQDVFVCRTCLGHNFSIEEKLEFKKGEDVLEEVEKFYLGDVISCYGGASEAVSARIGSAWKKFRELSGVLVGKQGLSFKQQSKIYQCCVRPVLLYCCEMWKLTVADEARLHGVESHMIRMCEVSLADRVLTDVCGCDRVGDRVGVVKIEDITQSCLQCHCHIMCGHINSQISEVTKVEITGKKKKSRPWKLWRVHKEGLGTI